MPIHRFALPILLVLAAASASGEEPRVASASAEVKARAAAKVLAAVTARDAASLEAILKAPVLCGPRLWQMLKSSMPNDKTRVGTTTLLFDTASGRESWGIHAIDLSTVSPDLRKIIEAMVKEVPGKIPVESGRFFDSGVGLLAAALRERFFRKEVTISQASADDIHYYWLMIPYDLEEPILRLDTSEGSLILDIGELTWIDLLPDDVVQADRAQKSSEPPLKK